MKCDVSLDELEKATQAPEKTEVELQKDMMWHHWHEFTIRDMIWHGCDAWKEVTESCICGAWKKLCPEYTVNFRGFDLSKMISEERLKCLELAKKVSLDELEEKDVNSLLETIGKELSTEDLNELEKQWRQLEQEVEAQQQPPVLSMIHVMMKGLQCFFTIVNQEMDHLEEIDLDFEQAGLMRHKVAADLAHYEQILY